MDAELVMSAGADAGSDGPTTIAGGGLVPWRYGSLTDGAS